MNVNCMYTIFVITPTWAVCTCLAQECSLNTAYPELKLSMEIRDTSKLNWVSFSGQVECGWCCPWLSRTRFTIGEVAECWKGCEVVWLSSSKCKTFWPSNLLTQLGVCFHTLSTICCSMKKCAVEHRQGPVTNFGSSGVGTWPARLLAGPLTTVH